MRSGCTFRRRFTRLTIIARILGGVGFSLLVAACGGGASSPGALTSVPVVVATARPMDLQCPVTAERCPLFLGSTTYSQIPGNYVALLNSSHQTIQIDSIQGVEQNAADGFGEYGAALDTFELGQSTPGNGDVEWTSKESGLTYGPLVWSDPAEQTALAVPPNHVLFVHSNDVANYHTWDFTVITEPATPLAVQSWRQPRMDQVIPCGDGTRNSTVWNPWQNTTGHSVYLHGAMIYAPNQVDAASASILDASGNTRWTSTTNMTVQGTVTFPHQEIRPNEYLAAQASLACTVGQWDWAAYLYVSDNP